MRSPIAAQTPRAFVDVLKDADEKATELRDLLLELMASPPDEEAEFLAVMTEAGTAKGLGHFLITTSKNGAWITESAKAIGDLIAKLVPAGVPAFLDAFVAGEVEAEMACPCGDCVPCAMRKEMGEERARAELTRQYGAPQTKRSRLVGPDGRPLQ